MDRLALYELALKSADAMIWMWDIATDRLTWAGRSVDFMFGVPADVTSMTVVEIQAALPFPLLGIDSDNGSEFISKALDKWAYENNVVLDFSRPGKPTDNAFIESFNGSFRDECLNTNWFLSLEDAREKIAAFKEEYNHFRPHSALGNLTPIEAIDRHNQTRKSLF